MTENTRRNYFGLISAVAKVTVGTFGIAHHIIDIRMTVGSRLNEILKKLAAESPSAQYF